MASIVSGSLRPQLKTLSRETREALLLALLEDCPKDLQCDLLDCEFHDHDRYGLVTRLCAPDVVHVTGRVVVWGVTQHCRVVFLCCARDWTCDCVGCRAAVLSCHAVSCRVVHAT